MAKFVVSYTVLQYGIVNIRNAGWPMQVSGAAQYGLASEHCHPMERTA